MILLESMQIKLRILDRERDFEFNVKKCKRKETRIQINPIQHKYCDFCVHVLHLHLAKQSIFLIPRILNFHLLEFA